MIYSNDGILPTYCDNPITNINAPKIAVIMHKNLSIIIILKTPPKTKANPSNKSLINFEYPFIKLEIDLEIKKAYVAP